MGARKEPLWPHWAEPGVGLWLLPLPAFVCHDSGARPVSPQEGAQRLLILDDLLAPSLPAIACDSAGPGPGQGQATVHGGVSGEELGCLPLWLKT